MVELRLCGILPSGWQTILAQWRFEGLRVSALVLIYPVSS